MFLKGTDVAEDIGPLKNLTSVFQTGKDIEDVRPGIIIFIVRLVLFFFPFFRKGLTKLFYGKALFRQSFV